jgi:hypothetical protein
MEFSKLSRSYSDKYIPGQSEYDLFKNKNVDWFSAPFVRVFYTLLVLVFWGLLHVSQLVSTEDSWTVTNMTHGVVSGTLGYINKFFIIFFFSIRLPSLYFIGLKAAPMSLLKENTMHTLYMSKLMQALRGHQLKSF